VKRLSIIIPTLDEAAGIVATLESLGELRRRGHEVIVVDGGSSDGTAALAAGLADRVLAAGAGRAGQMNAGARAAAGDVLLFLHAIHACPKRPIAWCCKASPPALTSGAASMCALRVATPCCAWRKP